MLFLSVRILCDHIRVTNVTQTKESSNLDSLLNSLGLLCGQWERRPYQRRWRRRPRQFAERTFGEVDTNNGAGDHDQYVTNKIKDDDNDVRLHNREVIYLDSKTNSTQCLGLCLCLCLCQCSKFKQVDCPQMLKCWNGCSRYTPVCSSNAPVWSTYKPS